MSDDEDFDDSSSSEEEDDVNERPSSSDDDSSDEEEEEVDGPPKQKKQKVVTAPKPTGAPAAKPMAQPAKAAAAKPGAVAAAAPRAAPPAAAAKPAPAKAPVSAAAKPGLGKGASSSSASAAKPQGPPASSSGGAAGAPAKKITTDKEAEDAIAEYMIRTNRPYSPINVFDNMHGAINKAMLMRLMDKLVVEGRLEKKEFGKSAAAVYWASQDQYGDVSAEALAELGEQERIVGEAANAAAAQRKNLAQQASQLGNAMTSAELEAALVTARKDVADLRTKMAALKAAQASGGLVTEKERTKAKATLERYRKAWKDRKNIVTDLISLMADGLDKKPKELYATIGLETDEAAGVNIKDFM